MSTIKDYMIRFCFIIYSYSIELCIFLREHIGDKKIRMFVYFTISPILILRFWGLFVSEIIIAKIVGNNRKKEDIIFQHQLSIVAIAKNEAPYIVEWIEFHKLVGVTKFYIFDNESNDSLRDILDDYIKSGEVVYQLIAGKKQQLVAYNIAIEKYKNESKFMAFLDLDEYLAPGVYGKDMINTINSIYESNTNAGGIGVRWRIFGSSGHEKKPKDLVLESYLHRGEDTHWSNFHIKTICNPRLVKTFISPHFPQYKFGVWNVNEAGKRLHLWYPLGEYCNVLKINHYFCKSKEEAIAKWNRGLADRNTKYDWSKFDEHDLNDIEDKDMLLYVPQIKINMMEK